MGDSTSPRVPKRIAAVIINSLKGGVVPRIGLPYITVGRETEIAALLHDLDLIANGGASFRFLVGRFGAGKSFLLQTIRTHAMGKGFVVADADLSPERRLQGRHGEGLATYRELIRNLSTKTRPEGGSLQLVLDRWVASIPAAAPGDATASAQEAEALNAQFSALEEMVHGFDFVRVLKAYRAASLMDSDEDEERKSAALRWLRGEFRTKTEAKAELGINVIITDDDWYDYLKLLAQFLTGAGYEGLLVLIDELVNLFKIPNAITRQYNYEKILTMYNDTLQGKAHHLGIVMGGTPQSIEDRRRGVYSYEALRSRLAEGYFGYERALDTNDLVRFLQIEYGRVGADTHLTPREVIRDFVELLDILYQNPGTSMESVLAGEGGTTPPTETPGSPVATGGHAAGTPSAGLPASSGPAGTQPPHRDFAEFEI